MGFAFFGWFATFWYSISLMRLTLAPISAQTGWFTFPTRRRYLLSWLCLMCWHTPLVFNAFYFVGFLFVVAKFLIELFSSFGQSRHFERLCLMTVSRWVFHKQSGFSFFFPVGIPEPSPVDLGVLGFLLVVYYRHLAASVESLAMSFLTSFRRSLLSSIHFWIYFFSLNGQTYCIIKLTVCSGFLVLNWRQPTALIRLKDSEQNWVTGASVSLINIGIWSPFSAFSITVGSNFIRLLFRWCPWQIFRCVRLWVFGINVRDYLTKFCNECEVV